MTKVTSSLIAKSPKDNVSHGTPVAQNDIEKNKKVSTVDPIIEELNGATYQLFSLSLSNICTSKSWAKIKAVPEPIAILTEIRSEKFVEKKRVKDIPTTKPK